MVEKCDSICDPCHAKQVYICLKSENEFLSSLLKVGKEGLLGYNPSELIDWHLYAKRTFSGWSTEDHFGRGIKLLDELGKLLFSINQVTAEVKPSYLLLCPMEQNFVKAFRQNDSGETKRLQAQLSEDRWSTANYIDKYECRIAFTQIEGIENFYWDYHQKTILLVLRKLFEDEEMEEKKQQLDALRLARLKLARAFLHGVALFALTDQTNNTFPMGYWITSQWPSCKSKDQDEQRNRGNPTTTPTTPTTQQFSFVPTPSNSNVQLSCELAASFAQEYWNSRNIPKEKSLFDILFMCKDDAGWFWVLTKSQLEHLQGIWENPKDIKTTMMRALGQFRFNTAGIINHLERTENLVEEVYDFREEKYICIKVGYKLEATKDISESFEAFEKSLPGVKDGHYFYFRITFHSSKENDQKYLPKGALVAIFRVDRGVQIADRLDHIALMRQLVEGWRAKVSSLAVVAKVVRDLSRPLQIKTARAAIMARNFSHNVGSHALANPNIYRKIGLDGDSHKKIKQRLETFHSYMQGRLDFLARAISDQSDRPEPLFFLNDVMNGFFKQGVLLDTLVDDAGFPAERIKFHVAIGKEDGGSPALYEWSKDTHCFSCAKPLSDDPVVSIPGGIVGTHAFYAFLENILRNAVKYGAGVESLKENTQKKLEIHLQLYQCSGQRGKSENVQPAWILSVWDNVSDGGKCDEIRNHINTPLIQEEKDGALKSEGHGIQEMKLCAEALAGSKLRFLSDWEVNKLKGNDYYFDYVSNLQDGKTKIKESQALRCYVKDEQLIYDLLLPNPVLLGIVPLGEEIDLDTPPPYVKYYKSIDVLAEKGAQIGILLDNGCNDKNTVLEKIAKLHTCLPFRLMVLIDYKEAESDESSWENTLGKKTLNDGVDFQWGKHIPRDRLRIHTDKTLSKLLKSGNPNGDDFIGCTAWEAVMLRAYDSWLCAYKEVPEGGKWNLCIGFDRDGEKNINSWKDGVEVINNTSESCIAISVVSKGENQQVKTLLANGVKATKDNNGNYTGIDTNGINKSLLMFDNHKKAFSINPEYTKFYQGMGGEEGLTLFQSLTSPPQSGLGFGLFVYSLAEGALTKVYTLDERVAEAVSDDDGTVDNDNVSAYKNANIIPLFRFDGNKEFYISKAKYNVNTNVFKLNKSLFDDTDVLLIHEGVMDLLSKKVVDIWQRERDTPKLFAHAPFVVRVSGRGPKTRHLDDAISFLEFNELSGNTYREMNKPRLVKALLNSSGSYTASCKSELIQSSADGEQ